MGRHSSGNMHLTDVIASAVRAISACGSLPSYWACYGSPDISVYYFKLAMEGGPVSEEVIDAVIASVERASLELVKGIGDTVDWNVAFDISDGAITVKKAEIPG